MKARVRLPLRTYCAVVILSAFFVSPAYAQSDPRIGTWKLNVAKSKFDPGPAPKSVTRTYAPYGKNGLSLREVRTGVDGRTTVLQYSMLLDGKDYPFGGSPDRDTIAGRRLDARTVEVWMKKGGKVIQTGRNVVSEDGKNLTSTFDGIDAQGRKVTISAIYDKQ